MIKNRTEALGCPKELLQHLPLFLKDELSSLPDCLRVEEIRLRSDQRVMLTLPGGNILLKSRLSRSEVEKVLLSMCNYSVYAHKDTIKNGYITLDGGIRVGICGRAGVEDGEIFGVYDVSTLNIRIPREIFDVGRPLLQLIGGRCGGVLIYSPPGEGKTTLLKSLIYNLSNENKRLRIAVIDTRGELSYEAMRRACSADFLVGYPKAKGIEIAARTMNAQLMVCDEIGDKSEALSIISVQNCGVPLLASAHADSFSALMRRDGIRMLHDAGVFYAYVGIKRKRNACEFEYDITMAEEI